MSPAERGPGYLWLRACPFVRRGPRRRSARAGCGVFVRHQGDQFVRVFEADDRAAIRGALGLFLRPGVVAVQVRSNWGRHGVAADTVLFALEKECP